MDIQITVTRNSAKPVTWTASDQIILDAMLARRDAFYKIRREAVEKVVHFLDLQNIDSAADVVNLMTEHAAQICEALKPFDRVAP